MKRAQYTYDHLLEFDYDDVGDMKTILKNLSKFQSLAEGTQGVSNAVVILADVSKALNCSFNGYGPLKPKQFEALYYFYICDFPLEQCSEMMCCSRQMVSVNARMALKKLVDILGNGNGKK